MLELILCNLTRIGYAAVLLALVWLANFLLDIYYNIAVIRMPWNCIRCIDGMIRFCAVCMGVSLLTVAISTFPAFISMVGLTVPEEYVQTMSVLTIIAFFAKGIYEYTMRAMKKLNSILKNELTEDDMRAGDR